MCTWKQDTIYFKSALCIATFEIPQATRIYTYDAEGTKIEENLQGPLTKRISVRYSHSKICKDGFGNRWTD